MASPSLQRRLGLGDAVFIGLGSMIGAGVFAVWAPAAQAAGSWLLAGLAVAAVVAFGNATSSAQLAAAHPTSGGTYAYGRAELGPWWGFLAGWCFLVGKTASCAAMALTFAAYAVPPEWQRPVGIVAVVALAAVNWFGVTRTATATKAIVAVALCALAVAIVAAFSSAGGPPADALRGGPDGFGGATAGAAGAGAVYGALQSAGLLFFAFAGYARIATMGEEVRDPRRTIPRAIVLAFCGAVTVYALVAVAVLTALGPDGAAASAQPVVDAAARAGWGWTGPVVRVGAAAAALGALLALIAGIGRTGYAMAREGDLPRALDRVHPRWHVPHRVEAVVAVIVVVLVATLDLRGAIGFSSFGVLLYYFVANVAALRRRRRRRHRRHRPGRRHGERDDGRQGERDDALRWPAALPVIGAVGCLLLVAALPWQAIAGGVAVVAVGVVYRLVRVRRAIER